MSDDGIVDLGKERDKREQVSGAAAHARGEAFAFVEYVYDDDGVGIVKDKVVVLLAHLTGIAMSKEDAAKLSEALAVAAKL